MASARVPTSRAIPPAPRRPDSSPVEPGPPVTHVPADVRRPQVVATAIALMSERGVHAVSTRAIAASAGVPQSTVHYLFGTREALLRSVTQTLTLEVCEGIERATSGGRTLETVLTNFVEVFAGSVAQSPGPHLLLLELTLHALRTPNLRDLARWQYAHYEAAGMSLIDRISDQTGSRFVVDGPPGVRFALALLDGITIRQLVDDDPHHASEALGRLTDWMRSLFEPVEPEVRAGAPADGPPFHITPHRAGHLRADRLPVAANQRTRNT